VVLIYTGRGSLSVHGPGSGQVYYFARTGQNGLVQEVDSEALLRTGLFKRG
jgi:hypothetical protein